MLKGLPLGYQRDLQEDKPPLFSSVTAFEACLGILAGLLRTATFDRDRMADAAGDGYTTATTLADALVRRGVPFRVAHHVVGQLVGEAERGAIRDLSAVAPATLQRLLGEADDSAARALASDPTEAAMLLAGASIEASIAAADVIGGTARPRVTAAIAAARRRLTTAGR
jgi:argininosuccinate lyase